MKGAFLIMSLLTTVTSIALGLDLIVPPDPQKAILVGVALLVGMKFYEWSKL